MMLWPALAFALLTADGAPDASSDRALASSALAAARSAVAQAAPDAGSRDEAAARLELAETLFESGKYKEAAKAADAAWKLVNSTSGEATRFAVHVGDDGKTTVTPQSGQAVHVEAMGTTHAVYPGQTATVEKGQSPQLDPKLQAADPRPVSLDPPGLVAPQDAAQIRMKPTPTGIGPLRVSWTPVAGATGYEVEIVPAEGDGRPMLVTAAKAETRLPPMAAGKYRWWVRAVHGNTSRSPASSERTFLLESEDMKLNVKTNTWK